MIYHLYVKPWHGHWIGQNWAMRMFCHETTLKSGVWTLNIKKNQMSWLFSVILYRMKKAEKRERKHLDSLEQHLLPIKKFEFHLLKCVISALFSFHAWVRNKSIRFLHTNCTYTYLWKYSVVIYTLVSIFERNSRYKQVQGLTGQKIRLVTFKKLLQCAYLFRNFEKKQWYQNLWTTN